MPIRIGARSRPDASKAIPPGVVLFFLLGGNAWRGMKASCDPVPSHISCALTGAASQRFFRIRPAKYTHPLA